LSEVNPFLVRNGSRISSPQPIAKSGSKLDKDKVQCTTHNTQKEVKRDARSRVGMRSVRLASNARQQKAKAARAQQVLAHEDAHSEEHAENELVPLEERRADVDIERVYEVAVYRLQPLLQVLMPLGALQENDKDIKACSHLCTALGHRS
jgi:hypothetical protein